MQRYFLTFCTAFRRPYFVDAIVVNLTLKQILRSAELFDFAVIAYCFMPDHVHLLIEAGSDGSDALAFVHQAKQRSAYEFGRIQARRLWQPSFYDRVLRSDEETLAVTRYILENPVRAKLVTSPSEYRFSGSTRHTIDQIMEAACWEPSTQLKSRSS